jgi:hypothetical protein
MKRVLIFVAIFFTFLAIGYFTPKAFAAVSPSHREWSNWSNWSGWSKCQTEEPTQILLDRVVSVDEQPACGTLSGTQTRTRTRTCQNYSGYGQNECSYAGQSQTDTDSRKCEIEIACPTPTPTVTPTVTPVPGQPDPGSCNGCDQKPTAFICPDTSVAVVPTNPNVTRKGADATVQYVPTAGDKVNYYWKELGASSWQFAAGDQPNNGYFVIHALNPNLGYVFGIQQSNGCSGGVLVTAVVIDGPAWLPHLFTLSYYTL